MISRVQLFSKHGRVLSCRIMQNLKTGIINYAFINMATEKEACKVFFLRVILSIKNFIYLNCVVVVEFYFCRR